MIDGLHMFAHIFKLPQKNRFSFYGWGTGPRLPQDGTLRWSFDLNSEDPQNPGHWAVTGDSNDGDTGGFPNGWGSPKIGWFINA